MASPKAERGGVSVLLFDLGGTLERNRTVLPHVPESLEAAARFKTADGRMVEHALVSDFHAAVPFSEDTVRGIFSEYLAILDGLRLRQYFEPVERRVTLSTHADVRKPNRRVFELALQRLGVSEGLEKCLFVTEHARHVVAARDLGMQALQFGVDAVDGFSDWAEGIVEIARRVDPTRQENVKLAQDALACADDLGDIERTRNFRSNR